METTRTKEIEIYFVQLLDPEENDLWIIMKCLTWSPKKRFFTAGTVSRCATSTGIRVRGRKQKAVRLAKEIAKEADGIYSTDGDPRKLGHLTFSEAW